MTTSNASPSSATPRRGLYDGYEGYRTPIDQDYRDVLTRGLVVLDTNTLLNLYRYTPEIRQVFLGVLIKLGDSLWIPAQVIKEFWQRRESAMSDYRTAAREFEGKVKSTQNDTLSAIGHLGNRLGLNDEHKAKLIKPIEDAFAQVSSSVAALMYDGGDDIGRTTASDRVLHALEPILKGRVGDPLGEEDHKKALAEARRRISAKEPPGFKDASKNEGHAEGDYLVWVQILREASKRNCNVLFVTADGKEDWWRSWGGTKHAGPRFELIDEFTSLVERRLFMLQPAGLLHRAANVIDASVTSENIEQARRVDAEQAGVPSALALRYEQQVRDAFARALDFFDPVIAAQPADFSFSAGEREIAVIVKYDARGRRLKIDSLLQGIRHLTTLGYGRVIIVCNRPPWFQLLHELSEQAPESVYVHWANPGDDDAINDAVLGNFE